MKQKGGNQHPGDAVKSDCGCHGAIQGKVIGQACGVGRDDGFDVDAYVCGVGVPFVLIGIKLDGDKRRCRGRQSGVGVAKEAEKSPAGTHD